MKNLLKMLGLALVITIIFAACGKEDLTSLPVSNDTDEIAGVRGDDGNQEKNLHPQELLKQQ